MGVREGHKAIDYIILVKSSERSTGSLSGIMGKAIPQMGPTVADTAFKELVQAWVELTYLPCL